MELNGSIKALIGAVLVLIACLAAVSVVCDDSDAVSEIGGYYGGDNKSSSESVYNDFNATMSQAYGKGTFYVAVGKMIILGGDGTYYPSDDTSSCYPYGLTYDGSGMDFGVVSGTVTKTGSFEVKLLHSGSGKDAGTIKFVAVSTDSSNPGTSDTTYVVTLKANGGTASAGSTEKSYSIISGQPFTAPSSTYTRDGYILMGWSESSYGSVQLYPGQSVIVNSNKTLYAVWQDLTYTAVSKIDGESQDLTLEADIVRTSIGAEPSLAVSEKIHDTLQGLGRTQYQYGLTVTYCGKSSSNVTTSTNTTISADWASLFIDRNLVDLTVSGSPTREGVYIVDVTMKTNSRLNGEWGERDDLMMRWYVVVPVSADEQPVLSFDMDGGTGSVNSATGPAGTATILPNVTDSSGNQIKKDGWTLVGWEIPDGKGSKSVYALGSLYTLSFDATAKAKWIQDPDVLVYSLDGGSLSNVQAYVVYDGRDITLRSTGVTKEGYTFIGWRPAQDYDVAYAPGLDITVSGSMYMEAYFVPNGTDLCTVTFDANGGQGTVYSQKVESGMFVHLPERGFVRDGYEFVGWSRDGGEDAIPQFDIKIESDTTLYAVWQDNSEPEPVSKYYDVAFSVNGGAESYDTQRIRSGGYATEPKAPTRDGHVFLGWRSLTESDMWDFSRDAVTGDTVLQAQWEKHFETVTEGTVVTITICEKYYDMAADIYWGDSGDSSDAMDPSEGTVQHDYGRTSWGYITVRSHDANGDYESRMPYSVLGEHIPDSKEWTIVFDPGNGSFPGKSAGEPIELAVLRGNPVTYPDEPTWNGHKFSGWYFEGARWDFERTVTRDMTLVASWDNGEPQPGGQVIQPKAKIVKSDIDGGWLLDGSDSLNAVSYVWTLDGEEISTEASVAVMKEGMEYGVHSVSLKVVSKTGHASTEYASINYPDPNTDPSPDPPVKDGDESWLDRNLWIVVAVILIIIAFVVVRFWI